MALPAAKRRKQNQPEEIVFDPSARQDYLTGFHRRKEARKKHAQEAAAKTEKEERVVARKQLRDQRKEDLEKHVEEFNRELKKQNPDLSDPESDHSDNEDGEAWEGIEDPADAIRDDAEYVDEDKYTTVTVEPMTNGSDDEEKKAWVPPPETEEEKAAREKKERIMKKKPWMKDREDGKPKQKKRKFRYETKYERQITRQKQKHGSRAAKARRQEGDGETAKGPKKNEKTRKGDKKK